MCIKVFSGVIRPFIDVLLGVECFLLPDDKLSAWLENNVWLLC